MKRKPLTLAALTLIAGTAAFAQSVGESEPSLNEDAYSIGMSTLTGDGYEVDLVEQNRSGGLTFTASDDTGGRILVLAKDGTIVSDRKTPVKQGTDKVASAEIFPIADVEEVKE